VIDPPRRDHGVDMEVITMRTTRAISLLVAVTLGAGGAALAACSANVEPTEAASSALSGGCAVHTGEMYEVCFVDGTGFHQGDVHDGGMPVLAPDAKIIFAFEPKWAPEKLDLSQAGIATAFAGPENVDSFSDPVPEDDPSHAIGAHIDETYPDGFEVAFDQPIADGMQVDVELAVRKMYASRIGPPCDLPVGFWCTAGNIGLNARFYVGSVPPADHCTDPDASACGAWSSAPRP
jgi:hypothetical protein